MGHPRVHHGIITLVHETPTGYLPLKHMGDPHGLIMAIVLARGVPTGLW